MKMDIDARTSHSAPLKEGAGKRRLWLYIVDVCIMVLMVCLLVYGVSWQIFRTFTDAARYECYAVDFWQGTKALDRFPVSQCAFITHPTNAYVTTQDVVQFMQSHEVPQFVVNFVAGQDSTLPFHALPHEYPLLTVVPFTLALLAPTYWYQVGFAFLMALVAVGIYVMLLRYRSRSAAIAFAFYIGVGGWGTAAGRFDLVPSALTLIAVLYAMRSRWNWAFFWLALATVIKFYPLPLLLPFLLAQQMTSREKWLSWRRLAPLGVFVGVCIVTFGASFLLSVEGTIGPLSYFENRPFQIESAAASVLWLAHLVGVPLQPVFTYGSLNVLSPLASAVSPVMTLLLLLGLGFTYWLQWRRKIDVALSTLLTLLIVMMTGKVFSPQYMIWVAPLVAYVGRANYRWLVSWGMLSLLTTMIYPFLYTLSHSLTSAPAVYLFYPTVAVRNLVLLIFIVSLLIYYARVKSVPQSVPQHSVLKS